MFAESEDFLNLILFVDEMHVSDLLTPILNAAFCGERSMAFQYERYSMCAYLLMFLLYPSMPFFF